MLVLENLKNGYDSSKSNILKSLFINAEKAFYKQIINNADLSSLLSSQQS